MRQFSFFYEIRICFRFCQFDYLTTINNMFPVQLNVSRMSESKEETLKAEIPGINKVQQKFKYNESKHQNTVNNLIVSKDYVDLFKYDSMKL